MRLSMDEFYLLHDGLLELMWKYKDDNDKCKAVNKLIERIRSESKKLADKYDFKKAHKLVADFKRKYYGARLHCPVCHGDTTYSTTYVGYVVVVKRDGTIDESFKDKNAVACKCGFKGILHDLLP